MMRHLTLYAFACPGFRVPLPLITVDNFMPFTSSILHLNSRLNKNQTKLISQYNSIIISLNLILSDFSHGLTSALTTQADDNNRSIGVIKASRSQHGFGARANIASLSSTHLVTSSFQSLGSPINER